ncbi:MAG TPA: glycosyltransferase family 4 protein [Candidatus Thermoplasmatota archaeon]|nr:glycosyltransferase family 4 protein [Candidatus Thermoplasmatota archaeon]
MARIASRTRNTLVVGYAPEEGTYQWEGVLIKHLRKPTSGPRRAIQLAQMFFSDDFGLTLPPTILKPETDAIVLESPFLFTATSRAGVKSFVLNAHNVYQDIAQFPQSGMKERVWSLATKKRQASIEREAWKAARHVIFCSSEDRDRAASIEPSLSIKSSVIPNCVDTREYAPLEMPFSSKIRPVMFLGTTRYPPNFFAVKEICETIAPHFPSVNFAIIGESSRRPRVVSSNVSFVGKVAKPAEFLPNGRAAIIPLRHGSGTRLKILEFFASGVPVVATAKACQGIEARDDIHFLRAETPKELIEALSRILTDENLSMKLAKNARKLVESRYDWRRYSDSIASIYFESERSDH